MRAQAPSQAASPTLRLMRPTAKGAAASGQMMPASSWFGLDQRGREPARADAVGAHMHACSLPSGPLTTAFIGSEYLVPK